MHGILIDITESKLAAEALAELNAELETKVAERTSQLVQAQKLDVVGQITGALAHDFNNLLFAIIGNLKVLQRRSQGDPAALKLIDGALQGGRRGSDLTKRLMSFVRRQDLTARPVDLHALLAGMDDLLSRAVGPTIEVELGADAGLWRVVVDPNQLELAILNLAVNGRDAMPGGGRLRIRLWNEHVPGGEGYPRELRPGDYVRITIEDTGVGMDEQTLARATEAFFTTKSEGQGTGLGLASTQSLAVQSGGALRLASTAGLGTTAAMWLPRVLEHAADAPRPEVAEPVARAQAGRLQVLLVETTR